MSTIITTVVTTATTPITMAITTAVAVAVKAAVVVGVGLRLYPCTDKPKAMWPSPISLHGYVVRVMIFC